jgi:2,3-bisphosphoglycerate-dependent phosphoglycerate mutase
MGWPRNLVMVRHAESEGNIRTADERATSGMSSDRYPLTSRGRKQAEITGAYLKEKFEGFRVYYVSYYVRSRETMEVMFPDESHYEEPRLAEANRGIWHTMTAAQVEARYPGETERKKLEGLYHYRPFGGENWPDIELRIHSFLGTLSRDYEGEDVVMVVHGHWLILLQRLIHRFSIADAMDRYKQGSFNNASITTYRGENQNGKSRLVLAEENFTPWKGKL